MTARENELLAQIAELEHKLDVSTRWMKRQVQESIKSVATERVRKYSRHKFQNHLERDQVILIETAIETYFGNLLLFAPDKTVERLIDAELQWYTLQKYPQMDGLALTMSYQKIFDACIEAYIALPFRQYVRQNKILLRNTSDSSIEKDIESIIYKGYNLSSGRLYQVILELQRNHERTPFLALFENFLISTAPKIHTLLLTEDFITAFKAIIDMEIFSKKRHDKKVSFTEAKKARALMVGNLQVKNSIFCLLFKTNSII